MKGLAEINVVLRARMEQFSKDLQNSQRQLKNYGETMKTIGSALSIAVTLPLTAAGAAAFNMAADFEDAMGATDEIFKKSSNSVQKWAEALPTYYGIAKKEALEYSNMMGSMFQNIGGLTEKQASEQSAKLIELAGDLTAMYGGTTADAVRALTGSLKGNNTMLDNYGIAVNEVMIKNRAFEMGLIKQGGEMDSTAKQAATLSLIYEQTGAAQGQAAREADGASGSMRALRTSITNLSTEFGQVLLPYVTSGVNILKGFAERISNLDSIQKKWVVGVGAAVAVIGPLTFALGTAIAMVPNIIAGFKAIRIAVLAMNAAFMTNPIVAVTAALAVFAGSAILLESRLSSLTNAQKEFDDFTKKTTQSVSGEIVETRKLITTAQNKKLADEERTRALDRLIKKSEEHFGKLTLETIGTEKAKKATDDYTKSLLQNARVKAAEDELIKIQKRKIDIEFGVSDEGDPSVWQTLGNKLLSAMPGKASLFNMFQDESKKENQKVVLAELDRLEKRYEEIIGVQEGVVSSTEKYSDSLNDLGGSANSVRKTIADYDQLISELVEKQKSATTKKEFDTYQKEIDSYKKLKEAITGTGTSAAKTKKSIEDLGVVGSIKWIRAQINDLEETRSKLDPTSTAYNNLTQQLRVYQNTLDSIQNPAETIFDGSEEWYKREIQLMEAQLSKIEMTSDAYNNLKTQIEVMQKTMELMQSPVVDQKEPEQDTVDWYNYHINKLREAQKEAGITIEEFKRLEQEISVLETTFKIQVEGVEETVQKLDYLKTVGEEVKGALNSAFSSMADGVANSFGEAENGLERFAQGMFKTVLKLIAMALSTSLANAIQGATQTGTATGPAAVFTTPAFIATAVGGIVSAFAAIPKFADGGIVSGPTLGLMGEYVGAANNPEVIAPLNKLKELIEPAGTGDVIVQLSGGWEVSGETLKMILERTERRQFRTG